jgi:hypothetical protein
MNHMIDPVLCKPPVAFSRVRATTRLSRGARGELAGALGPIWSVHREADHEGEVSIVVLPADDDPGPAFILYEKDGLARVGTVSSDEWISDEGYFGIRAALEAIVAKAAAATARSNGD